MRVVPTARQRETYELVRRLGTIEAAARHLGISPAATGEAYRRYLALEAAAAARREERAFPQRVLERVGVLEDQLERIEAKLDRILARPITVAVPRPANHRRIADGGRGAHRERKATRAA